MQTSVKQAAKPQRTCRCSENVDATSEPVGRAPNELRMEILLRSKGPKLRRKTLGASPGRDTA